MFTKAIWPNEVWPQGFWYDQLFPSSGLIEIVTTWKREGEVVNEMPLNFWVIDSARKVITSGSTSTDEVGTLSVSIPKTYIGQSVIVAVNDLEEDMGISGRFHSQQVITLSDPSE